MDKTLKVYIIPEYDKIVSVLSIAANTPAVFSEGDRCIKRIGVNATLYIAEINQSTGDLEWIEDRFTEGMYYFDLSTDQPSFCLYTSGTLLDYNGINFPDTGVQAELFSFDYSASRMGNAPVVSATLKYRTCLDDLWTDRCCVYFNRTFHFIDKIPQSEYSNQEDLYKHTAEFVSERILLENVYFANVVDAEHIEDDNVSQYFTFNFFGNIAQFVARLNESLKYSGIHKENGYGFKIGVDSDPYTAAFIAGIEEPDKLVSVSEMKIKDALDEIYNLWGVPYYYDGYDIHIGFSNDPLVSSSGSSLPTFDYGITDELLSLQKSQTNDIVNRITGFGSSENIPYFYPNDNPNSIVPHYTRSGSEIQDGVVIANPYKTTSLEPSTTTNPNPNGTYFKYGLINKEYKYDQYIWAVPNYHIELSEDGDIVNVNQVADNSEIHVEFSATTSAHETYQTGVADEELTYVKVRKNVYCYLDKDDTFTNPTYSNLTIKDTSLDNVDPTEENSALRPVCIPKRGTVRVWGRRWSSAAAEESKELWDSESWSLLKTKATVFTKLTYTVTFSYNYQSNEYSYVYTWSDNTTTDTFAEKFPVSVNQQFVPPQPSYSNIDLIYLIIEHEAEYTYEDLFMEFFRYETSWWRSGLHRMLADYQTWFGLYTRAIVLQRYRSVDDGWSMSGDGWEVPLRNYGLRVDSSVTPAVDDIIYFTGTDHVTEMQSLLPYNYRHGDGLWLDAENNEYEKQDSTQQSPSYYSFETEYKVSSAKERISKYDDIKPTIEGCYNNETPHKRIDRILDYAFDQNDNSELDNEGKAKHPYFFVKLAKTSADDGYGFNLFDCAINDGTMQISMKSGPVGGCTFDIMVEYGSDGYARNPIGLFTEATTINGVTYAAGTPKRDTSTGTVLLDCNEQNQQDTSENSVWIALKKDNSTFAGEMLPNTTIHPNVNDEFKILNINLPIMYVVEAEKRLMHALLTEMENDNPKKYNFNIKLSSINYKLNRDLYDRWLNEASKISFIYNGHTLSYYVSSYAYKMQNTSSLPEVTLELTEKLRKIRPLNVRTIDRDFGIMSNRIGELDGMIRNLQTSVTDDTGRRPANATLNNLRVVGDITLSDGTTVQGQLESISRRFDTMTTGVERETAWNEVAERSEIENLFIDGTFMFDYNKFDTSGDTTVTLSSGGFFGGNKITCSIYANRGVAISQKVGVLEGYGYTVCMNMSTPDLATADVSVALDFYDDDDKTCGSVTESVSVEDSNWKQHAFYVTAPDDASYFTITILNEDQRTHPTVSIDGIMVFADDYTTIDEDGNTIPSGMLPTRYKISQKELQYAIQTSSSNPYITTSVSEIELDNEGSTAYVAVRSNTFWEVFDK